MTAAIIQCESRSIRTIWLSTDKTKDKNKKITKMKFAIIYNSQLTTNIKKGVLELKKQVYALCNILKMHVCFVT